MRALMFNPPFSDQADAQRGALELRWFACTIIYAFQWLALLCLRAMEPKRDGQRGREAARVVPHALRDVQRVSGP